MNSFTKIFFASVAIFVIIGGAIWWLVRPPTQSVQEGNMQSTGYAPNRYTITVPGSSTPLVVDIDKEYAALFSNLSAKSVAFSLIDSATGKLAPIYALYENDITLSKKMMPAASSFALQVAFQDLNADGLEEIVVYESLPGFCGSGGCPLDIYTYSGSAWTQILSTIAAEKIGIAPSVSGGYKELFLTAGTDTEGRVTVVRYIWDGSQYAPGTEAAYWDGTKFVQ